MKTRRHIFLCTDDQKEAFDELRARKAEGHRMVAVAETRQMLDPPRTIYKFVVYKIIEEH